MAEAFTDKSGEEIYRNGEAYPGYTHTSPLTHVHDDGWGNCRACWLEFEDMRRQVNETHAFVKSLAEALNNPMLKAMLPPQMRGMLGG